MDQVAAERKSRSYAAKAYLMLTHCGFFFARNGDSLRVYPPEDATHAQNWAIRTLREDLLAIVDIEEKHRSEAPR